MVTLKIRQLEAAVKLKKIRFGTGNCAKSELDIAEQALKNANSSTSTVSEKNVARTKSGGIRTEDLPLSDRQRTLLSIRSLRKERDELSNQLHLIPIGENCQTLTLKILGITREIESKWTIYKHGISKKIEVVELIIPEELLRNKNDRRVFGEERRKIRWKLRQKGQKVHLVEKWKLREHELNSIIENLDEKIRIQRNQ